MTPGPADGRLIRNRRLCRARADPRRPGGRACRRVRARLPLVRDAHWRAPVHVACPMSRSVYAHLEEEPPRVSERRPGAPRGTLTTSWPARWRRTRSDGRPTCGDLVDEAREALGLVGTDAGPPAPCARCDLRGRTRRPRPGLRGHRNGYEPPGPAVTGGTIVRIDPATNRVSATYPVSATPGSVTTARNRVWVGDFRDGSLWRLDPVRGDLERLTTTGEPRDLTSLGGYVYVAGTARRCSTPR